MVLLNKVKSFMENRVAALKNEKPPVLGQAGLACQNILKNF
jgi:hypothetical protein